MRRRRIMILVGVRARGVGRIAMRRMGRGRGMRRVRKVRKRSGMRRKRLVLRRRRRE
jgi:hypothetical protein